MGTVTPSYGHRLNVVGNVNITGDLVVDDNTFFVDAGNDNKVGIGTITPTHELNVVGNANITGDLFVGNTTFNGGWQDDGVSITGGDIFAQTLYVYNITSLAVSHLDINGSLIPFFDNEFDIGNVSNRYRNLYLSGDMNVSGDLFIWGQNASEVYVPYTGATKNIDLSDKNLTTDGSGEFGAGYTYYTILGYNDATDAYAGYFDDSSNEVYICNSSNSIYAEGDSVFVGNTLFSGTLNVSDDMNVSGDLLVENNLSVTGNVTADWFFGHWNGSTGFVPYNGAIQDVNLGVNNLSLNGTLLIEGVTGTIPIEGVGTRLMWIPNKAAFRAGSVDDNSWDDANIGNHSFAIGYNTNASGDYSFASGYNTTASGYASTAMGANTLALRNYSFASGYYTRAIGDYSFASGYYTNATGNYSTAMGANTLASAIGATAVGYGGNATGNYSFVAGLNTTAAGKSSFAVGERTIASGNYSTAIGYHTNASGATGAIAIGYRSLASSYGSIAIGTSTLSTSSKSIAIGDTVEASNIWAMAMGYLTEASGIQSTAIGVQTTASGQGSTAMGFLTTSSGYFSTATGIWTSAFGNASTAMGYYTIASGQGSTAMGFYTRAVGDFSTVMGYYSNATANYSTAIGRGINCSQENATCFGVGNVGIGVGTPTHTLNVLGDVNITGDLIVEGSGSRSSRSYLSFVDTTAGGICDGGSGGACLLAGSENDLGPINYTMMRDGTVTGISVYCDTAPDECADGAAANFTVYINGVDSYVSTGNMSCLVNYAYNISNSVASFSTGDRIAVFSKAHTCTTSPIYCQVLVEIET